MLEMKTRKLISPLILGVLGIILSFSTPILGIVLGVVGIITSKKSLKYHKITKIAFILSLVAVVISILMFIFRFTNQYSQVMIMLNDKIR